MSVATELTKLNTNIKNAYDEIATKGGTIPQNKNTDNLATAISSISGGGGGIDEYFDTTTNPSRAYEIIIKLPDITTTSSSLANFCAGYSNLKEVGNITATNCSSIGNMFNGCNNLEKVGNLTFGNVTSFQQFLYQKDKLISAPALNTQYSTNFMYMYYGCVLLENVPVYNFNSATNLYYMYGSCPKLTDQSLDNILQSCITATSYTGTKTLRELGITLSVSKLQTLPHYQDFLDAGWTR